MSTTVNWNYTDENGTTTSGSYSVNDGTVDNTDGAAAVSWIILAAIIIIISGVSYCIFVSCRQPITVQSTPTVGLKRPLTMKDIEDEKKWRKNKL